MNLFTFSTTLKSMFFSGLFLLSLNAHAIAFGEPDNNRHPGVASLRFIELGTFDARISCTGTLIHQDRNKYVVLTAAHCAQAEVGGWNSIPPATGSVGVSFDEKNLPNDPDPSDGGADGLNHVSGGVAITHPLYRFPGEQGYNDSLDIAIVVFPINAVNSHGQTISERWGRLPLIKLATLNQVNSLLGNIKPNVTLLLTAVGYGTASDKSPQGAGTGNMNKIDPDSAFPNRNLAFVIFRQLNNDMIDVDVNMAQGEATGYLCPGDSGGPSLYKDSSGKETILGVLTAGNCRSHGAYSRIDLPNAVEFLKCAFVAGDASKVQACVKSKF